MFFKNARIFTGDFQFYMGAFEVKDGVFGRVLPDNLSLSGKDFNWLQRVLSNYNTTVADTWLLTVDAGDHILWYPREDSK